MTIDFDMSGKVALASGASSGFGAHFAKLMAAHGAKVVLAARRLDRLQTLIAEIRAAGGEASAVQMDVTRSESIRAAFDAAEKEYGTVSVVSNNAGVVDARPALEIDEENWDYILDTNLKGAWLVAREAGSRMISAGIPGSIVNTASILGLRPGLSLASYATSKAGIVHLTRCLALEWARKNIRVNALCPGYFVTDLSREFLASDKGQKFIDGTPARRTGELSELSAPFLLLASDAGSYMTGVALPVDGGLSLG